MSMAFTVLPPFANDGSFLFPSANSSTILNAESYTSSPKALSYVGDSAGDDISRLMLGQPGSMTPVVCSGLNYNVRNVVQRTLDFIICEIELEHQQLSQYKAMYMDVQKKTKDVNANVELWSEPGKVSIC